MDAKFDWFDFIFYGIFVAICAAFFPIVTVVVTASYLVYLRFAQVHGLGLLQPASMVAIAALIALRGYL